MATFSVKPTEGQDPWGATDLAWRASVESAVNGVEGTANAALPSASFDTRLATRMKVDNSVGRTAHVWDATNSRWQLIYGDTGVRSVAVIFPEITSGLAYLYRTGPDVTLVFQDVVLGTASGTVPLSAVPAGFVPYRPETPIAVTSAGLFRRVQAQTNGVIRVFGVTSGEALNASMKWRTNDVWPTSLPGTAAGSIPNA